MHVSNYFLIVIGPKNDDRTNKTYHMWFQSIQNDNYIGQIRHLKYMLRVYMGLDCMGRSLKHT